MPIVRSRVARLLNESEYQLYEASRRGRVEEHAPSRLAAMVARTRKLQDKFRKLAATQAGAARGKRPSTSARKPEGNDNTALKADIFTEILGRLEAAQQKAAQGAPAGRAKQPNKKLAKSARRVAKKEAAAAAPKKAAAKKAAPKKAAPKKAAAKKTAPKKAAPKKATAKKNTSVQAKAESVARAAKAPTQAGGARKGALAAQKARIGRAAATGRRNQARRDKR